MKRGFYLIALLLLLAIFPLFGIAQDVTFTGNGCNGAGVSGSWTVPCGVSQIKVECYGGGGGGGGGSDGSNGGAFCKDNRSGGGGGGGSYTVLTFNVTPNTTYTYSAGGGGCGGKSDGECRNGNNGNDGGNSTFTGPGASLSAGGGKGGKKGDSGGSGGLGGSGGVATGGSTNTNGTNGAPGSKGTLIGGAGGNGGGPLGGAGGTTAVHVHNPGANYGGGGGGADDDDYGPGANGGVGVIYITYTATAPPITVPTISSTPATCLAAGSSSISNFDPAATYVFTPAGPTVSAPGTISGMAVGTNYTVVARINGCNSNASAPFSNAAQTAKPATPTVTTSAATCGADGVATISNYNSAYTYNFNPTGPTAGAGGVISGVTAGTNYTVVANDGSCNSNPSSSFSVAAQLVPTATPTINSVAATCMAAGSSSIANYNAAYTYTFNPAGPTAGAGGTITGMVNGTSYTLVASDGNCPSAPSASFSNSAATAPPSAPIIASLPPSCTADGGSGISNYIASYNYIFSPTGPTVAAPGVISGMVTGTSYTVIADDGACTSQPSASFSNAPQLVEPAAPTIASLPPSCTADGGSGISNFNAAYTYTFSPAGPTVAAPGVISGMATGTSYTVVANDGTCSSQPSTSFSNAAQLAAPAAPTIASLPPSCTADGGSGISNYNAAYSYTFTPAGPTVAAPGVISGMVTGTAYTVVANDGTCPSPASASFSNAPQLVAPDAPTINSTPATCLADGSSAIGNYNAAYTYTFTPAGPSVGAGGAISGMVTGTSYTVDANDGTCTSQASVPFSNGATTAPPNTPTLTSVPESCTSDGVTTITNYVANLTYLFTPAGPTVGAGGVISGTTPGTNYTVEATDGACTSTPSAPFSNAAQFPTPTVNITGTLSYCAGLNTTLTANSSAPNFQWNDPGNTAAATITVTQGSYTVTVTDANNCTATASATVVENPLPNISFTGNMSYCAGGNTTITATGGTAYSWSSGDATATATLTQGTYTVTVTDANNCVDSNSVTITENPMPIADFTFDPKCTGQEILFNNLSSGATDYTWSFGNGATSADFSPAYTYANGGTFNVVLKASNANCSATITKAIVVTQKPTAQFTASQTTLIQNQDALEITNTSTNADTWAWDFGDGNIGADAQPQHVYAQKGVYTVTLIASVAGGCADTFTRTNWVNVIEKPALYIPNLFSPNDDGVNDVFKVEAKGIKKMELKIYNRWGEKVFETKNENIGWDGYYGGKKVEPGVYSYHLSITYDVLNTQKVSGTIILLR